MKSSTRLDSAIFNLTPTRTRCELLVTANGKTETIASGLVKPFLAHLKTAQDQVAQGGYSIILKPEAGDGATASATWFTKGTIKRFVRFVSNPGVLERVHSIETEIIQIMEAIRTQNNSDVSLTVDDNFKTTKAKGTEGSRPLLVPDEEKAIVLYEPGSRPQQANGSTVPEENSKAQVLKVLETRKTVLQKEQGMAFARAAAADFDIDDMGPLISFAKSFGASRLMDACVKFMDLWKKKHESGQWVEIETAEVMSAQPDVSDSGIVFTNGANMRRDSWPGTPETNNVKSPGDNRANGQQELPQGQFPQSMYPPWPLYSPPGAFPAFQGYPMQGMPYYPSYPGTGPYPSPYQSSEDPRYSSSKKKEPRHHSSDSEDSDSDVTNTEKGRSGRRRKSGKVVIRNINYISSEKQNHSGTDSDSEIHEEETHDHLNDKERTIEGDSGNWQAFQTYLLQDADRDECIVDHMTEHEVAGNVERYREGDMADMTRKIRGSSDESFISREHGNSEDCRIYGQMDEKYMEVDGKRVLCKRNGNNDEFMIHRRENGIRISSDPLIEENGCDNRRYGMEDDSYIVPLRSPALDEAGGNKRNGIDIGSEIPATHLSSENEREEVNYEPHDLSLMPERTTEKLSSGYDPALDFGSETRVRKNKAAATKSAKDPKSRLSTDAADKRKVSGMGSGPIRKGRSIKMSPSDEAKARAEKLRNFKADLQKMKKEKEEEDRKRIEALKLARQKRIAAKSNSASAHIQLPSEQTRKRSESKLSPSVHKGSKFSDAAPGSSSPLQRFPVRTASLPLTNSQKLSKKGKGSSTGSNSTGNRLTRSISSLSLSKRDNQTVPEIQTSVTRTRRLSEPKMRSSAVNSSVRPRGMITSKRRLSDAPETKKLSAIVNYDKTKIASLPELKIKTSKGPATASVKLKKATEHRSLASEVEAIDESPVIEKTVVMLECEKLSVPAVPSVSSDERKTDKEALETMPDNVNGNDIVLVRLENLSDVVTETPKFPTSQIVVEKPYEAPYARASSMDDPCTQSSEYSWVPPSSLQMNAVEEEPVRVLVATKLEKVTEGADKVQMKESASKGLRKLLKFGRKGHNADSDVNSHESHEAGINTTASSQAFTLKNLISQAETPTAAAGPNQKSSRHFSLLSPFKNKTSEKKMTS